MLQISHFDLIWINMIIQIICTFRRISSLPFAIFPRHTFTPQMSSKPVKCGVNYLLTFHGVMYANLFCVKCCHVVHIIFSQFRTCVSLSHFNIQLLSLYRPTPPHGAITISTTRILPLYSGHRSNNVPVSNQHS